MIVEFKSSTKEHVVLYFERTEGKNNSVEIPVLSYQNDTMTVNQRITKAYAHVRPDVLLMFNRVWEGRFTPETKIFDDIPEYGEPILDSEGTVVEPQKIIWGKRFDNTPINHDLDPEAISPYDEKIVFKGFEYEALPMPPFSPSLQEQVIMLKATVDLLMSTGGM